MKTIYCTILIRSCVHFKMRLSSILTIASVPFKIRHYIVYHLKPETIVAAVEILNIC